MWALWLIPAGIGFVFFLWLYDWLTTKESIENAIVRSRSHAKPVEDHYFWAEGGSFFLYDRLSRDHYDLILELEGGKMDSFPVSKETYEKTLEGTVFKVRCAKGKIFSKRIKGLV